MAHTFVVSDEQINLYGFRVITAGIDTTQFKRNPIMLYMHNRSAYQPTGDEVIGRWENVRVEGTKLLADAVFDESSALGKKIADKVRGGFIRMASIGIRKKEISEDKKHLLAGQTRPTVTKSVLDEISIVDMGGNNNALKLYGNNGELEELEELNIKPHLDMSELKSVNIALGLDADAPEAETLVAIATIKSDKENAQAKLSALETAQKEANDTEAAQLLAKAKELGLVDDAMKATYEALFAKDHSNTKQALERLMQTKQNNTGKQAQLGAFLNGIGGEGGALSEEKMCFDYLQKHDTAKLKHIKENEPETYSKMASDYANGKRYNQ